MKVGMCFIKEKENNILIYACEQFFFIYPLGLIKSFDPLLKTKMRPLPILPIINVIFFYIDIPTQYKKYIYL